MPKRIRIRRVEKPLVQERVRALLDFLDEHGAEAHSVGDLSDASGLRPQQTAVALVALLEIDQVRFEYRGGRRLWSRAGAPTQRSSVSSPLQTWYTVAEAAKRVGISEKALRGRIARDTLSATHEGRNVFVSHAALQKAGLLDQRVKQTKTGEAVTLIVQILRSPPREAKSTWQVGEELRRQYVLLDRQTVEVVLATFAAAGVVERRVAGGNVWTWRELQE